jgi:predicted nucleic-acid-binding Zn-ribbon protein
VTEHSWHLARTRCPKCGGRDWTQPRDAKGGFGAWEVACLKCGHRTYQSMSSYIEAHEEGQEPPRPPVSRDKHNGQ